MPPRRLSPKTRARSRRKSTNGADPNGVVLEDLRGQMRVVIESLQGCASKTDLAGQNAKLETMSMALEDVTHVVRATRSELVATNIDLATLRNEVTAGFDAMNRRFDSLATEVAPVP